MNNDFVIGVLGGMGTYATIQLFRQYAEIFPAEKEWDRPRIIIDNRCTMPSRVLAFLHHKNEDQLIDQMSESLTYLSEAGATRIILACNTSHLFLPRIYEKAPGLESKICNIILNCVGKVKADGVSEVYLLGSEGTITSGVYQDALSKEGINCHFPTPDEYDDLRCCIEAVKQNKYTEEAREKFIKLTADHGACILGCTELPILYEKYSDCLNGTTVYDPLEITLKKLKSEFDNL